jgi:hypothetical protein
MSIAVEGKFCEFVFGDMDRQTLSRNQRADRYPVKRASHHYM